MCRIARPVAYRMLICRSTNQRAVADTLPARRRCYRRHRPRPRSPRYANMRATCSYSFGTTPPRARRPFFSVFQYSQDQRHGLLFLLVYTLRKQKLTSVDERVIQKAIYALKKLPSKQDRRNMPAECL